MLIGSWRSDEEMKAGQETWLKALEFHRLALPDDGAFQYFKLLIKFMLNSPRYSQHDIVRYISMMNYDVIPYLEALKSQFSNEIKSKIDNIISELGLLSQANENYVTDITNSDNSIDFNNFICFSFTNEQLSKANEDLLTKKALLNDEQSFIFKEISERLITKQQITGFIQGKAGTGKSFLIHSIISFLITNKIPYIVCASTGIAASLINGKTVHSSFGLFTKRCGQPEENVICSLDISKPNGFAMTKVQVIIVDEVTMISGKVLSAMESGLRKIMSQINSNQRTAQFGGKTILLFGDLAQVPAVTRSPDDFLESLAQFHENDKFEGFIQWELKRLMRQSPDELLLINILEYIRKHSDKDELPDDIEQALLNIFKPGLIDSVITEIDDFVGKDNPKGMTITFTNKNAQIYNQKILEMRMSETKNEKIHLDARFFFHDKSHFISKNNETADAAIRRQASLARTHVASTQEVKIFCGAMKKKLINTIIPFSLDIIIGARVMLLQNIDLSSGLINGSRGTVISYEKTIEAISVKFDNQSPDESPILITRKNSVDYQINAGKTIFMYMFPLKLSWAVTAHKSQGQTLEKAAIHIRENAFAHGSLYVALSRVKSLNNLMLFGLEKWPKGSPKFHMNPYIQSKENEQTENEFI